jgi:hypothetical protein
MELAFGGDALSTKYLGGGGWGVCRRWCVVGSGECLRSQWDVETTPQSPIVSEVIHAQQTPKSPDYLVECRRRKRC